MELSEEAIFADVRQFVHIEKKKIISKYGELISDGLSPGTICLCVFLFVGQTSYRRLRFYEFFIGPITLTLYLMAVLLWARRSGVG